jgi:hypothetical protein
LYSHIESKYFDIEKILDNESLEYGWDYVRENDEDKIIYNLQDVNGNEISFSINGKNIIVTTSKYLLDKDNTIKIYKREFENEYIFGKFIKNYLTIKDKKDSALYNEFVNNLINQSTHVLDMFDIPIKNI